MNLNTETFTPVLDQDMDMNHRPGSRPFSLSVNKPLETHGKKQQKTVYIKMVWRNEHFRWTRPFCGATDTPVLDFWWPVPVPHLREPLKHWSVEELTDSLDLLSAE